MACVTVFRFLAESGHLPKDGDLLAGNALNLLHHTFWRSDSCSANRCSEAHEFGHMVFAVFR